MNLIYKQLLSALDEMGVTAIEAEGKEFDSDLHNAVMHEENDWALAKTLFLRNCRKAINIEILLLDTVW